MAQTVSGMTDQRRALLTEREREILTGDADVTTNYRYSVESRIRSRLKDRLEQDIEVIRTEYPEIFDELVYPIVCQPTPVDGIDETAVSGRETEAPTNPTDRSADSDGDDAVEQEPALGQGEKYGDANAGAVAFVRDASDHVTTTAIKEYVADGYDLDGTSADSWWRRHGRDAIEDVGGEFTRNKGWEITDP